MTNHPFPLFKAVFSLSGMHPGQSASPTGRMIQRHTVIMFKDPDSAQFSLVKLEQSVLESKRILFCGCLALLEESALPRLVTTCWKGWEWFREGSWITEILFIYSESLLFLQTVLSLQLLGFMANFLNCVKRVWPKGGTAESGRGGCRSKLGKLTETCSAFV